jgi:hypothetical protein
VLLRVLYKIVAKMEFQMTEQLNELLRHVAETTLRTSITDDPAFVRRLSQTTPESAQISIAFPLIMVAVGALLLGGTISIAAQESMSSPNLFHSELLSGSRRLA